MANKKLGIPISGTFTLTDQHATCVLPYDATDEEIKEAVAELDKVSQRIEAMKKSWPHLNELGATIRVTERCP
jgi:hypothetical protein